MSERQAIVIPVYQPTETLYNTVERCARAVPEALIIVVDDGSYHPVNANRLASEVVLHRHSSNLGKGAALRTGFESALQAGCEGVTQLDADGQHPPELIPKFIQTAHDERADIVIGNRLDDCKGMPWDRRISNQLSTRICECMTGTALRDVQCGFRWINLTSWSRLTCSDNRFEYEGAVLLQAAYRKWRFAFVPVPVIYSSTASQIRRLPDTVRFIAMAVREFRLRKQWSTETTVV